jgi:HK97 family phage prohead protease
MSTYNSFPIEIKFLSETGAFEGYASVFAVVDSANDCIEAGAFKRSLAQAKSDNRLPPLLWQHDTAQPIGAWREIDEDGHGLFVKGELFTTDIPRAREAYRLMKENALSGLSIGYRVKHSYRDADTGVRHLTDIELHEISVVTFPANDHARVLRVKSNFTAGQIPTAKECEAILRDAGMSRKQAKGFIALGYKSLLPREAGETDNDTAALHHLAAIIRNIT